MIFTESPAKAMASISKPWMKYYPEPMRHFEAPDKTLRNFMLQTIVNHDNEIIEYYGHKFTLNHLLAESDRTAQAMASLGIHEGDKIVVFLRAVPEFLFILFAAEKIGAAVVCRDGTPEDNIEALQNSEAKIAFAHDYISSEEETLYYQNSKQLSHLILVSPYTYAHKEEIPRYVEKNIQSLYPSEKACGEKSIAWNEFMDMGASYIGLISASDDPNRPLYCSYTSGSTAPSKEVIHTASTMTGVISQLMIPEGIGISLTVLHTLLPPALVAIVNSILLYNIACGNYLILDVFCALEDIDIEFMRYKPNHMIAVPMMADFLMRSKRIPDDYPMDNLYVIGGGADPVHNKWLNQFQAFLRAHHSPAVFSMSYGLSEAGSVVTNPHPDTNYLDCGSGIPMRGTTVAIFEDGTQNELGYGEVGEICVSGPGTMIGYATEEDNAEKLQRHPDGKIWVHTGDYGLMNENGEVFVYSRGLNRRYGGGNLYTTVMENKVIEIKGIADCFFVMVPDKEHEGYILPYLYLVLEDGVTLSSVEDEVHSVLDEHEQPVKIFLTKQREYFHFKTNRRILAAKILEENL